MRLLSVALLIAVTGLLVGEIAIGKLYELQFVSSSFGSNEWLNANHLGLSQVVEEPRY